MAFVCWHVRRIGACFSAGWFADSTAGPGRCLDQWVTVAQHTPVQFMLLSQAIIFLGSVEPPMDRDHLCIRANFLRAEALHLDPILWGTHGS